ncbi:GFA family protein [Spongiibacter taiwanensis]|uniref:GFA family protein n=1 Tax=Spongiibacter taiwanensis TaxID=1748242 RepID=UPI00203530A4|nr:GFA family protein [Spongiibacter taiwanensis]USA43732.1 GFA family protein [Spongiibacter taiwanensis]
MKLTGRCYCGNIHYQVDGDVMMKGQCHCRECQYLAGGGANYFMMVNQNSFEYTQGTPTQFRRSDIEKPVTREFCSNCGTQLLTRAPGFPAVIVKVGTLDDPSAFGKAQVAIFTKDKQPFHLIADGVAQFEAMPPM